MRVQYFLMFINRPVQIPLNDMQIFKLFLLFGVELAHIDILLLELLYALLYHLTVSHELFLCIANRRHIFQHEHLVIGNGIAQRIAPHAQHCLFIFLKLDAHEVEYILDFIDCLVVALLFQMKLKNHLMNRKLHVIFNLKCGEHQIVTVLCQIVGGSLDSLVHIDNTVCDIADIHDFVCSVLKIKALKIHGSAFI